MKEKTISTILKIMAVIIFIIGVCTFFKHHLWRESYTDFFTYLKTFLPILVLGFSGTLYGLATLINKDKK